MTRVAKKEERGQGMKEPKRTSHIAFLKDWLCLCVRSYPPKKAIDRGDRKHLFYFYDDDYLIFNLFTFLCVYVTNIKLKN